MDGNGDNGDDAESDYEIKSEKSDEVGSLCLLCNEEFEEPVQAPCGHIFCEKCALRYFKTNHTCFKCGKETNGTFKDATKVLIAASKVEGVEGGEPVEVDPEDFKNQKEKINQHKYTAQSGWYIP